MHAVLRALPAHTDSYTKTSGTQITGIGSHATLADSSTSPAPPMRSLNASLAHMSTLGLTHIFPIQISGIANRTTLADGNTWNHAHIALIGRCLTSPEKRAHEVWKCGEVWAGGEDVGGAGLGVWMV